MVPGYALNSGRGRLNARFGILLTILLLVSDRALSDEVARPVTSIQVSRDGLYRPGFMYWYTPYGLFQRPSELVLLGAVTEIRASDDSSNAMRHSVTSGHLEIKDVILCPQHLREQVRQIRSLECEGFDGLAPGDTALVFMVPYEGQYAIPNRLGTNCSLGYKLPKRSPHDVFDPQDFVDLLGLGTAWDLDGLTPDQLRIWAWVDPHGVAEALILERESREDAAEERK